MAEQAPEKYCFFGNADTNVMAVVGDGTAFDANKERPAIRDLPKDLILIVEVKNTCVHWMEPGDLAVTEIGNALSRNGNGISLGTSDDGYHVGFVDGEVWLLSYRMPPGVLLKFCTPESAERYDRDNVLAEYCVARSGSW